MPEAVFYFKKQNDYKGKVTQTLKKGTPERNGNVGLFMMLRQQEKMIRINPGARSADLLKKVFSK